MSTGMWVYAMTHMARSNLSCHFVGPVDRSQILMPVPWRFYPLSRLTSPVLEFLTLNQQGTPARLGGDFFFSHVSLTFSVFLSCLSFPLSDFDSLILRVDGG